MGVVRTKGHIAYILIILNYKFIHLKFFFNKNLWRLALLKVYA